MVVINLWGKFKFFSLLLMIIIFTFFFKCDFSISSWLPRCKWCSLDHGVYLCLPLECILLGTSILLTHIFFSFSVFLNFILTIQLRSLRSVVLPDPSSVSPAQATATVNSAQRRRRIVFLFLEAVTQILYMGWLVKI